MSHKFMSLGIKGPNTQEYCYILVDDPKTSQLINPKESKTWCKELKPNWWLKKLVSSAYFFHRLSNHTYGACQLGIAMKDIHNHWISTY